MHELTMFMLNERTRKDNLLGVTRMLEFIGLLITGIIDIIYMQLRQVSKFTTIYREKIIK